MRPSAIAGAYVVEHLGTEKWYVGSTSDLIARRSDHNSTLRRGVHKNEALQKAYNQDPRITVKFIVTEDREQAYDVEEELIRRLSQEQPDKLFNIATNTRKSALGLIRSEETKQKMSLSRMGKGTGKQTPEHVEKCRLTRLGKKQRPEVVAARRARLLGRTFSETQLENMRRSRDPMKKPVCIDGTIYPSLIAASQKLGVNKAVVGKRLRSNTPRFKDWVYVDPSHNPRNLKKE